MSKVTYGSADHMIGRFSPCYTNMFVDPSRHYFAIYRNEYTDNYICACYDIITGKLEFTADDIEFFLEFYQENYVKKKEDYYIT